MSEKFEAFKAELIELCKKHEVLLCTSEYDELQLWDDKSGEAAAHLDSMEDRTK